jgi:phosphatidylserine synthase
MRNRSAVIDGTSSAQSEVEERHYVWRGPSFSPIQAVSLIVGLLFIIVGAVALARTGIHFNNVPSTRQFVDGLGFTCLSGLVVLVVGAILALSAMDQYAARGAAWFVGVLGLTFGLVVALTPNTFLAWWGFGTNDGVTLAILGGLLIGAGALLPMVVRQSARVSDQMTASSQRGGW